MAGEFGDLLDLDFSGATSSVADAGSSFLPALKDFSLGVSSFAPEGLRLASEAAGSVADPGSGGGGFWSNFFKTGKDVLGGVGDVAKSVLPFASLGTGIMGAINSRELMSQIAKQQPITQRAQEAQIKSAEQGQALAPRAAAVAPEIKALAPRFGELSTQVQAVAPEFASLSARTRAAADDLGDTAASIKTMQAPKFGDLASRLDKGVASPEIDYGNKLLAMASAGSLMEADKARLDDWERRQIADAEGYLSRSGQGDSTARETMIGDIRAKRAAAESEILSGYRSQALQYLQAGGGTLTSGVGGLTAQQVQTMMASGQVTMQELQALAQSGQLSQQVIQTLVQAGALTAEQAAVLGASVAPLTAAGGILAGSAGAASAAAASSQASEKTLEELIAGLQQQLGLSAGRAG